MKSRKLQISLFLGESARKILFPCVEEPAALVVLNHR